MHSWELICLLTLFKVIFGDCVELHLEQGTILGHQRLSYNDKKFLAFEGIPFAQPPVGDLRFADPVPAEKWNGVLPGNISYTCAQLLPLPFLWGPSGTEDCLYLYVYVPGEAIEKNANLPVVVHIHGGAFMLGSPHMMALPEYVMNKNVIYVTINYRLGILGFLSTEDDIVPGNMGLKDQAMALKWIKENIIQFGGNPDSITITGVSAGGASVHYHYLSPLSKDLFSRGYSISGTALQSWALTENPLEKAKFVAQNLTCTTESVKEMVDCLRTTPMRDLIVAIAGLFVLISAIPPTPFGPVIEKAGDKAFIKKHPFEILKSGEVYDVPWINSNVKDEGIFPVGFFLHMEKMELIADDWNSLMPALLDMVDTVDDSSKEDVVKKVKDFYYGDKGVLDDAQGEILIKVFNDRYFFIDSELATRFHAKAVKSPVYNYFYKYLPETNFILKHLKPGVAHGLDGKLMFKWMIFSDLKPQDEKMMHALTTFLEKFAATGVPEINGVKWDPVNPEADDMNYLEIRDPNEVSMKSRKSMGPTEFWDSLPIKENKNLFP